MTHDPGTTIRILIVDDSFFMRKLLRDLLETQDDIEVVGEAKDGVEAISEAVRLQPDVITMDYHMPRMNGVDAVVSILSETANKPSILMLSATTREGAEETFECLRAGAVDYIVKPSGELSLDIEKIKLEILTKIRTASQARVLPTVPPKKVSEKKHTGQKTALKLIAIGASTGGPPIVEDLLAALPGDLDAAILITQHMPAKFTKSFAERLDRTSDLIVREAKTGDEVKSGHVFIAPGGYHMLLDKVEGPAGRINIIKLTQDPPVNNFRPSVDVMMKSVAEHACGSTCVAVLLTGMGEDGREGVRAIKDQGGYVIAQAPATAVVSSMPDSVIKERLTDAVLPPVEIPRKFLRLVQ